MPVLYIIRGLPGSGKSTLAKKLVPVERHREADMYHTRDGKYDFKLENIKAAHAWCKSEIYNLLRTNEDCAVSNTFTRLWEYEPYIKMAEGFGYSYMVIDCFGTWKNDHNVPIDVICDMKERFEPYIQSLSCILKPY